MKSDKDRAVQERIAVGIENLTATPRARDTSRPTSDRMPLWGKLALAIGGGKAISTHARMVRRSFPIRAYVGPNGGGKTLCMVNDILPSLERGRTVLSTVRILDYRTGEPHKLWEPFENFEQLLDARHVSVVADEVVGIASSRESSKLPAAVQNRLVQLRRADMDFSWSAPNWARADKIIREVTQLVTECRGYAAGRSVPDPITGEIRQWSPRQLFRFRAFDTIEFEEWTAAKKDKIKPLAGEWFKGTGSLAFASYDTLDSVSMVAAVTDGQCDLCGGVRRPKTCRCEERSIAHKTKQLVEEAAEYVGRHHASREDDDEHAIALLPSGDVVV